ncbi:MAG: hypothetical protein IT289_02805 [Oligoflexia bacterium]|nr:hypothetical protein [Oligoflexia bacterium]
MTKLVAFLSLYSFVANAKPVDLKWKQIDGAKAYELEVSESPEFTKTVLSKTVKTNALTHDLKAGSYYLRVRGIDQLKRPGKWSRPFNLAVTAPIKPMANPQEASNIKFISKAPTVPTEWKTSDKSSGFKVVVVKDGKEVFSQDTKDAKIDFKPSEPGNYKVIVRSAIGNKFGPPVPVKQFQVEQTELNPPVWAENKKRWRPGRPVELQWHGVEGAEAYSVRIYKKSSDSRGLANEKPLNEFKNLEEPRYLVADLPEGKYFATVSSHEGKIEKPSTLNYEFEVKKERPIEVDHFELSGRYSFFPTLTYTSGFRETGRTDSRSRSLAGEFIFDGEFFSAYSSIGVKIEGTWGGLLISGKNLSYNRFVAAALFRTKIFGLTFKPHMGLKVWTMPIIAANDDGDTSHPIIMSVTTAGPTTGMEVEKQVNPKWTLFGRGALGVPMVAASLGSGLRQEIIPSVTGKFTLGAKYAFNSDITLTAEGGLQTDRVIWKPSRTPSGGTPGTSNSHVTMESTVASVGIESAEMGDMLSGDSTQAESAKNMFSTFDLKAQYSYTPWKYTLSQPGERPADFTSGFAGHGELEAIGWFGQSKNGFRATAGWGGLSYQNTTVSFLDFEAQWGRKLGVFASDSPWKLYNFLGARSWTVPMILIDSTTNFFLMSPNLFGLSDQIALSYDWSDNWQSRFTAAVSAPLMAFNKPSWVSEHSVGDVSTKLELTTTRYVGDEFSLGLALGFRSEHLSYKLDNAGPNTGRITMDSPTIALLGAYQF